MKTSAKYSTLAFLAIAAIYFVFFSLPEDTVADDYSTDPLTYPVLLVHGLGDGPGDATFGHLQEYLEKFYFNVEVMDFATVSKVKAITSKLKRAKKGGLDHLAAALGNKIERIRKQRKVGKVHIVAHSYGGLIVQAYLLNFGAGIDPARGGYKDNVAKVVYLQTPFYGSAADSEYIKELAVATDYSVFLNPKKITASLAIGSEWIQKMDEELRKNNIYDNVVDAITLTSSTDEIVTPQNSTLEGFTGKIYNHARYKVFRNYTHSTNPLSVATSAAGNGSLALVDSLTGENFVAISSFLDNGKRWRRTGNESLPNDAYLMLKYEKEAGFIDLLKTDVTLTYKGPLPGARKKKGSNKPTVYLNEETRTFIFSGFNPGTYKLMVKNSKNDGVDQDFVFGEKDQVGFHYYPTKNELFEGTNKVNSNLKGLYVLPQFTITSLMSENLAVPITGLNTNNFDIEFNVTGAQNTQFDKGRVIVLYNDEGSNDSGWNSNGGRLEVQLRGWNVHNGDLIHAGKIAVGAVFDKNKSGYLDDDLGEWYEGKGEDKSNDWKLDKHHILLRIRYDGAIGKVTLIHNGKQIATHDFSGPYYNPKPVLSIGGRRHDVDYQAPIGAVITDLVIRNVGN